MPIDAKTEQKFQAEAPKIPLLPNPFDRQLAAMYYENAAYETVYKRSRFRNSQDLIFHNLKVKRDPMLAKPSAEAQTKGADSPPLYRDAYSLLTDQTEPVSRTLSQADVASLAALPRGSVQGGSSVASLEPQKGLHDASRRLRFDSEFESGNLEGALYEATVAQSPTAALASATADLYKAPAIEKYKLFV